MVMKKKSNLSYIVICLGLMVFNSCLPKIYTCPNAPITITLGNQINKYWTGWDISDSTNISNKLYYKFVKKSYFIKKWSGQNVGTHGKKKFIACCRWLGDEKKNICAVRVVAQKHCDFTPSFKEELEFNCND